MPSAFRPQPIKSEVERPGRQTPAGPGSACRRMAFSTRSTASWATSSASSRDTIRTAQVYAACRDYRHAGLRPSDDWPHGAALY